MMGMCLAQSLLLCAFPVVVRMLLHMRPRTCLCVCPSLTVKTHLYMSLLFSLLSVAFPFLY